jgi:hypothetical protein
LQIEDEDDYISVTNDINLEIGSSLVGSSQVILDEKESVFKDGVLRKELIDKSDLIKQQA